MKTSLRVIGAGMGRTGTMSLKKALEFLLNKPCYHMVELLANPEHVDFWHQATFGAEVDWIKFFEGYGAGVDFPVSSFWQELSVVFPEALILLSIRPADEWWESASKTIFAPRNEKQGKLAELSTELSRQRFPIQEIIHDKEASMKLYEERNSAIIANAPAERLVIWEVGDGWKPLCDALHVPEPEIPFPHQNTQEEFIGRLRSDAGLDGV